MRSRRTREERGILPLERAARRILLIRGQRVMIDADLADMYSASTKALNQAVKRNAHRFPADFAFRLTAREKREVVTNCDHLSRLRFSPVRPWAFTEYGAIMAANLLNSRRAVDANVTVVRAFIRLRQVFAAQQELSAKIRELERKVGRHGAAMRALMIAFRRSMESPRASRRERIGFYPRPWEK